MKAQFYKKLEHGKIKCELCPHNCLILPDKAGICGVRANRGGELESLIYGKVSSACVDPIEKKPLFHFYPGSKVFSMGTLGCNMSCGHCQNWNISHVVLVESAKKDKIYTIMQENPTQFMSPEQAVQLAIENECQGIAWTYNEPTIWFEYTYDCAKIAKSKGLYTVYVTNGFINKEPLDTIGPYLDAFRVDIKGFSDEFYRKLAKIPYFKPILEAAEHAKKKWNMHVEIVTNIIPTMNDDEETLKNIANWIKDKLGDDTPWHVTRFMPELDYKNLNATPVETLEHAQEIGFDAGLKYVYIGNVPGHPGENTYCPNCHSQIIKREGYDIELYYIENKKCKFCGYEINVRE